MIKRAGTAWRCGVKARAYSKAHRDRDPEGNRQQVRDWKARNPDGVRARELRYAYGIELADYEALLEQQSGVCAICGSSPQDRRGHRHLVVDHDHLTGAVRGLLCQSCNRGIGALGDDPLLVERALRYLERNV